MLNKFTINNLVVPTQQYSYQHTFIVKCMSSLCSSSPDIFSLETLGVSSNVLPI